MPEEAISPEAVAAPTGETVETPSDQGPGASSTHYKTLEEADTAARNFQGKSDRLEVQIDRMLTLRDGSKLSVDEFVPIRDHVLSISQKSDYQDYVAGKLGVVAQTPESSNEEPYMTDTERAQSQQIGNLETKIQKQSQGLATLHFGDMQGQVEDAYGGLLTPYRQAAQTAFNQLVQMGVDDPTKLTRKWVEDLYIQQVPLEDRPALWESLGKKQAEGRLQQQQARGTTVPSPERTSTQEPPSKSLLENLRRGYRETAARDVRGG